MDAFDRLFHPLSTVSPIDESGSKNLFPGSVIKPPKGGVITGIVWWLWFRNEDDRRTREALLTTIIASFPALAIARVLSWIVNRTRPVIEKRYSFRIPYGEAAKWEGPSSFPSDHAVFFFALAMGIFFASRRAGWFAFFYISVLICLPRFFSRSTTPQTFLQVPLLESPWHGWPIFLLSANP